MPPKVLRPDDSDDDDDAPLVARPTANKPAATASAAAAPQQPQGKAAAKPALKPADDDDDDDDDDDEPVVQRGGSKASSAAASSGAAAASSTKPAAEDDDDEDEDEDDTAAAAPKKTAPHYEIYNYDELSEVEFLASLKKYTKKQRVDAKRILDEISQEQTGDAKDKRVEQYTDGTGGYTYDELLTRAYDEIRKQNPEYSVGGRIQLPTPKVEKSGTKKTAITNFKLICERLNRPVEEVKDFIEKHLTTQSSVDGNNCLIIKIQNVKVPQVEKVFQTYIEQYVRCHMCGKINTTLNRDTSSRLLTLSCNSCKATRNLQQAGAASYQAQTAKRSRQRNKQL